MNKANQLASAIVEAEEILLGARMMEEIRAEELVTVKRSIKEDIRSTVKSFLDFARDDDNTYGMSNQSKNRLIKKIAQIGKLYLDITCPGQAA